MADQYAKPGDIVEVTYDHPDWKGLKYEVIEYPPDGIAQSRPGDAWGRRNHNGTPFVIRKDFYIIVKQTNRAMTQNSDVDKSLDRQRDDQLRSLFGFD